ncbi:hypothetical protein DJ253_17305 [Salmonella enterica subsp. enterica serovar Nigeria]|nr:hypothetical protein [Salmonella enterica subsp. enterica serovar Nigeria]
MNTRQHDMACENKEDCGFFPERANTPENKKNSGLYEESFPTWTLIFLSLISVFISGFLSGVLVALWFISNSM